MLRLRTIQLNDLEQIFELSAKAQTGLTTLPHDKKILKKRIEESIHCFQKQAEKPYGEDYLFVLEQAKEQRIIGTCAIFSKVGGFQPFYSYKIEKTVRHSDILNVSNEIQYLQLLRVHNGPSEIGTLFLHPDYRKQNAGRLLSLSRFIFIASFRDAFEKEVIAELRGYFNDEGKSPFWEALGRHFFNVDFNKADLMVMRDKLFIEELIPQHPIYIPLLPKSAQEVLGKVHKNTEAALHLLKSEGFQFREEIDIFEAGPVYGAKVDAIRTVKESKFKQFIGVADGPIDSAVYLVAKISSMSDFVVTLSNLTMNNKGITLPMETVELLGVKIGDWLRVVPVRADHE